MYFSLDGLGPPKVKYAGAVRRLALGQSAEWTLHAGLGEEHFHAVDALADDGSGRLNLGPLVFQGPGGNWEHLVEGPAIVRLPDNGEVARLGPTVTVATTRTDARLLQPRFHAHGNLKNAGQLLLDLGLPNTNRVQEVLDRELPQPHVPLFVQDGYSNLEALAWVACLLSAEASRGATRSAPAVTLSGSDGSGWYMVPLHSLAARRDVPHVQPPTGMNLAFRGWCRPPLGPFAAVRHPDCACAVVWGEAPFQPSWFQAYSRQALDVLPWRLPAELPVADVPKAVDRNSWFVIASRDTLTHDKRHQWELFLCADPAAIVRPLPPAGTKAPGGIYLAEAGKVDPQVPDWTVPCRLLHCDGSANIPVALTTIYSGRDQRSGVHLVPERGAQLLVGWAGRLTAYPVCLAMARPAGDKRFVAVRRRGPLAVEIPKDRGLDVRLLGGLLHVESAEGSSGAMEIIADGNVQWNSRQGHLTLHRQGGRKLRIGDTYVDIDPP